MRLVTVNGLRVALDGRPVLRDVSFGIDPGEIVTIVGPNGSGKSTLMRAIIGAVRPNSGTVTRKPGLRMGYVPQRIHIDSTLPLSVRRFLSLPAAVDEDTALAALREVGAEDLTTRQMADLSGGQFQRVLLARALLCEPELLLLDEAAQGLDQQGSAAFYKRIEELRDRLGCSVLMVSHELHVVMAASDRVICLDGHICCEGTPEVVASAPQYRALFGTGTGGALALYRHRHGHGHHAERAGEAAPE